MRSVPSPTPRAADETVRASWSSTFRVDGVVGECGRGCDHLTLAFDLGALDARGFAALGASRNKERRPMPLEKERRHSRAAREVSCAFVPIAHFAEIR